MTGAGLHRRTKIILGATAALLIGAVAIPNIFKTRIPREGHGCRETPIAHLRAYLSAQNAFHRTDHYGKAKRTYANPSDGNGFPDLYRVGGPDARGEVLDLIPLDLARAMTPDRPKTGYYFVEITGNANGPYDYSKQCGLCAVPAKYGKSGRFTYIVNVTGTIYQKDTAGRPVTVWPDVEKEGWIPVGSE